jgi:hypothetical protein
MKKHVLKTKNKICINNIYFLLSKYFFNMPASNGRFPKEISDIGSDREALR